MTRYFRLFAGLMSLVANLWDSHFRAGGPGGTLPSSLPILPPLLSRCCFGDRIRRRRGNIFAAVAAKDGEGNDHITGKDQHGTPPGQTPGKRGTAAEFEAEGLEHRMHA